MKLSGIQLHKEKKGRAGFSLVEILVVVALIAILMGVGIMALFRYQKTLRQRELDSKAEIIYMAAQYRMAELRIGGFEKLYGPDASGVDKAGIPVDADENNEQAKNLYYVNSVDKGIVTSAAQTILPQSSVDAELWDNEWIIEYNPETGTVYAVFYSLEPFAGDGLEVRLNQLRSKDFRLSDGARVGYYGGDLIDVKFSDKLIPLVTITNAEKLIAHFSCQSPNMDAVEFTITVEDVNDAGKPQGHSYTKVVPFTQLKTGAAGSYTYEWVMDSLNPNEGSFFHNTKEKIPAGANIRVSLSVKDIADSTVAAKTADATTNSLFKDYSAATKTATVAYGRHLQNLDSATSQVGLKQKNETYDAIVVEKAIQDGDISFMRDDSDPECYHSCYGTAFTPILNNDLLSYKGNATVDKGQIIAVPAIKGLTIVSNKKNVGLFDTFHGTVENLILTGTKVTGTASSNVGGLMGAAIGETTICNVQLYLSELQGDLQNARLPQGAAQDPSQVSPWLQGQNVGGLVGTFVNGSKLSILNSSASTVVSAENTAGGLVGRANRRVDIISSYSDSYLKGTTTGGLVGYAGSRADIYLQNFYAAGFQAAAEKAAGLVVFDSQNNCLKSATNGYAAVDYVVNPGLRFYILAPKCASASDVFYIAKVGAVTLTGEGLTSITAPDLSGNGVFNMGLKAPFTRGTTDVKNASNPYLLMNQNLGAYPYPRLSGMRHYGDWSAEFQDGALVYFEVSNNAYSFWGGNVAVDNIYRNDGDMDYSHRVKLNGDGYALAFLAPRSAASVSIQYNGKDVLLSDANCIKITAQGTGTTYYLYPLDIGVLKNDDDLRDDTFYQKLYVQDNGTEHTYYFNPNFAKCISENVEEVPTILRIRSPRQLFALSRLYARYSALFTPENAVFQEMDLDYRIYDWQRYYGAAFTAQNVIGTEAAPFVHRYDGQGYTVLGANVSTQENYAGLFGTVGAQGRISNVALLSSSKSTTITHKTAGAQDGGAEATLTVASGNKTVGVGALAGRNQGRISNCAAAGFSLSASGYNGVHLYVGGLVGSNEGGTIRTSSADTPSMVLTSYQSDVYGGGMVGRNSGGSVIESYAFGAMNMAETDQEHRNTYRISGFAGDNASGTITRCYAGMALVGGGDTEIYGFTRTGGTALGCYYLDGGTYSYRDEFYSFNTVTNEFAATAQGTAVSGEWMVNNMKLTGFNKGATALHTTESTHYPYPASVRRGDANVHYGYWPSMEKNVGEFGVFYWEQETGKNGGVHITFQGTSNGKLTKRYSTLCTVHNDGGEVVSYGYGYYYKPDAALADNGKPYLETQDCTVPEEENAGVEATLKKEFSQYGYEFVAYTTGDSGLRMDTDTRDHREGNSEHDRNATWKLYYPVVKDETGALRKAQCGEYTYSVSPFFANAFSLDSIRLAPYTDESGNQVTPENLPTNSAKPGSENVPYQVRSLAQLQYINWNYVKKNATTSIESARSKITSNYSYKDMKNWNMTNNELVEEREEVRRINGYYFAYPYLSYGHASGLEYIGDGIPENVLSEQRTALKLSFVQGHDIGSTGRETEFTPIGGMTDCEKWDSADSKAIMAYFTSSYNGKAYTIRNVQITSNAQCLGLFGITVDANMHNVVLYGNVDGAAITHLDSANWYCVGGLVGLAGQTADNAATFKNCTVSGYTIKDLQSRCPGWGGGILGGLVGSTTMNITGCSAVNNIDVGLRYNEEYQNCRIGGLVGSARAEITNCYAGGKVTSSVNQNTEDNPKTTSIWISGLSGGIVLRTGGNLNGLIGNVSEPTRLYNCYSYTELPESVWGNSGNGVKSTNSIASNGELQAGFATVAANNDYVEMHNCYALTSAVEKSREYTWYVAENWDFKWKDENVNPFESKKYDGSGWDRTARRIQFQNGGNCPYINYGDMQAEALCELLNGGEIPGTFREVTKTENGVETEGKFTFAGGDPQLEGMNYPFPAVLTQNGSYVHYGVWPKHGLYWQSKRATLDLVTDRNTTGQSLLPEEDELQPVVIAPEEEKSAEAPKAETPETPKAETPETPKAETPETPKAETPETPKAETPETPKAETPETPKTQGADLPKMEIVEAPQKTETPEPVENSQENKDTGDAPEESPVTLDLPEPKEENRVADAPEEPENPNQEVVARFMANAVPLEAKALQATLDFRLYVIDLAGDLSGTPTYSLYTEDGKLLETQEDIAGAAASFLVEGAELKSDDTGSFYTSTFLGQHPGVVKVKAELGGYSATFTLTVTTTLEISVVPEGTEITVYEGEAAKDISIALTDGTSPFTPGEDAVLEWGLQLSAAEDILSWDEQFIESAEDGSFALTGLKGLQGGDGSLTLTLTYTWGKSEGITAEPKLLQLSIPVTVYSSDVLGLSDGESFAEVSIPHTPKASDITKGGEVEYEQEDAPNLGEEGLFLYVTNTPKVSYTDLKAFTVETAELKVGTGGYQTMKLYEPQEGEPPVTDGKRYDCTIGETDYRMTLEDGLMPGTNTDFAYRLLTLDGVGDEQWSLRLSLTGGNGKTYVLTYQRPNTVYFVYQEEGEDGTVTQKLADYRVPQDTAFASAYKDLTEDTLSADLVQKAAENITLPTLEVGKHWVWKIPQDKLTGNLTVAQQKENIRYQVKYNVNYPDADMDDNTDMPNSTFTFGEASNHLAKCTYQRPGYKFLGWAMAADATVPDYPYNAETDSYEAENFVKAVPLVDGKPIEHGETLELYALWELQTYTITLNYQDGVTQDATWEFSAQMESKELPVPTPREGYTFKGWAVNADGSGQLLTQGATLEDAVRQETGERVSYTSRTLYAVWEEIEEVAANEMPEEEETVIAPEKAAAPEPVSTPAEPPAKPTPEPMPEPEEEPEEKTESEEDSPEEKTEDA